MKVEKNKVVAVAYALRNEENGAIVDQATAEHPLEFLFGRGMMLQKFEDNLAGLEAGQSAKFHLSPEEGYGEYHKEMVVDIPRQVFETDGVLNEKLCKVGNHIPMQDNRGNHMVGIVVEIGENSVKMDFNHDMAGKELYFSVDVISIRDAEPEEIEHGHVHHEGHCCHNDGHCHKHDGDDEHCCHKHEHDGDDEHCCHKHDHDDDEEHHCCHKHDHDE